MNFDFARSLGVPNTMKTRRWALGVINRVLAGKDLGWVRRHPKSFIRAVKGSAPVHGEGETYSKSSQSLILQTMLVLIEDDAETGRVLRNTSAHTKIQREYERLKEGRLNAFFG